MKRNHFITGAAALLSAPIFSLAAGKTPRERNDKGFKVESGEGRLYGHIKLKGINSNVLDVKISGKDNNGAMSFLQQTSLSPGRGTPLHIHHFQDEIFYVVEGSYYFQVGSDFFYLNTGDSIFMPMKVPHAWTQISQTGKMNVIFQPAGKMEYFFTTVASMEKEPTPEEMKKIFSDSEMQIVGPPLKIPNK